MTVFDVDIVFLCLVVEILTRTRKKIRHLVDLQLLSRSRAVVSRIRYILFICTCSMCTCFAVDHVATCNHLHKLVCYALLAGTALALLMHYMLVCLLRFTLIK